ncbi:MAG: hypothetical protein RLZZ338_1415 [Cyanobacteriota bacterium]|jgi:response regulator of citrate/malate metabolism
MNDVSIQKLTELANDIFKFLNLDEDSQNVAFPLLSEGIKSSIRVLKLIENQELTYEEISEKAELHENTVRQKLLALVDGNYPGLSLSETTAIATTGRPRTLVKKEVIK